MPRSRVLVIAALLMLLTAGCASTPSFTLQGVERNVSPAQTIAHFDQYQNTKVLWGGIIINSTNTQKGTQIELLAYPLDSDMRPQSNAPTQGRFLANVPLYLETTDYAPGRMLTVVGTLVTTQKGEIGEAEYTYPVLQVEQHYLWPRQDERPVDTSVHFGFGVILH